MTAWDDLSGRRALVTGAAQGIGAGIAAALRAAGARVTGLDRRAGPDCIGCDLADPGQIGPAVDRAAEVLGGIDILVNNAAYQHLEPGGIADITTEQFDRVMKTNLYALFWLSKFAVAEMRAGSTIVNTTSIQAVSPSPGLLDYATTKAGIVDFTKGLAADVASKGIRVNAVAPGPIWTPLIPATMPKDAYAQFGRDTPLGRPGQPSELAPAYVFLASQESSYITGETIAVTGGVPFT